MITIKDVAKRACVSISTVSRVLNDKVPVEKKTKEKVYKAVSELKYRPNILAKGLKEGKTKSIGLIIPDINNSIFSIVTRGVEDEARRNGYIVILCDTDEDFKLEKNYIDKLRNGWVDGFVIATASINSDYILELKESSFPIVLAIRNMGNLIDSVVVDNYSAAYNATEYLINHGCKKISILNGRLELSLYNDRFNGYKDALVHHNFKIDKNLIFQDNKNAYKIMDDLLNKNIMPDGIFCATDIKAMEVMKAIKDYGFKIPQDISVIGFDNINISEYLDPPLTTVSQPLYEIGVRAANRLIKIINRKRKLKPIIDVMNTTLIIRKSTK